VCREDIDLPLAIVGLPNKIVFVQFCLKQVAVNGLDDGFHVRGSWFVVGLWLFALSLWLLAFS